MNIEVCRAKVADVPGMVALVDRYAKHGEILPRTPEEIYQTVREWVVAKNDGQIVGCGSLVILWADLAEVRSLVVSPGLQGMGIGRQIIDGLVKEAETLDIPQVFALTREVDFFLKMGFQQVPRDSLPRKIWKDCIHCTKFVSCDEVAMVQAVQALTTEQAQYRLQWTETVNAEAPGA